MKFSLLLLLGILAGCMTVDRKVPPKAELIAPPGTTVTDQNGKLLRTWSDDSNLYFSPKHGDDKFVSLEYRGDTTKVYLSKHVYPWMVFDLLSFGTGLLLDDITNTWYDYNTVCADYDTSRSHALSTASTNWLGESSGYDRPKLLLLGSLGIVSTSLPQNFGSASNGYVYWDWGAGIDFGRRYDIFYSQTGAGNSNVKSPWLISTRYFFARHFFAEFSGGALNTSYYLIYYVPNDRFNSIFIPGKNVPVLGLAAGWAGDYSYISLHLASSTQQLSNSSSNLGFSDYYHIIALSYGIYLRF